MGVGFQLLLSLLCYPLAGVRAVSLFTLCKDGKSRLLCACVTMYTGRSVDVGKILLRSKSRVAPASSKKSVPNRPAASVGSARTKNLWLYSRPSNSKVTDCRPFISRASPVTPYGFREVTLTSLFDTRGWSIKTLEPVSTRRLLVTPMFTNTEGVPHSDRTETDRIVATFSGEPRRKELPAFTPLLQDPASSLSSHLLEGFFSRPTGTLRTFCQTPFSGRVRGFLGLFLTWLDIL
jgi:hypothetical protein